MPGVVGKPFEQDFGPALGLYKGLDVRGGEAHHPVLFGDVKPAVFPVYAVGDFQPLKHQIDPFRPSVPVGVPDGIDVFVPGADENHAQFRHHRHGAGAGHAGVLADGEPGRQPDPVQGGALSGGRRYRREHGQGGKDGGEADHGPSMKRVPEQFNASVEGSSNQGGKTKPTPQETPD